LCTTRNELEIPAYLKQSLLVEAKLEYEPGVLTVRVFAELKPEESLNSFLWRNHSRKRNSRRSRLRHLRVRMDPTVNQYYEELQRKERRND
jgi:hypothetical protein